MSKIFVGPVGPIVKGNVLDVAVKPFVEALKEIDRLLYVVWNPNKLGRHGCWEIRRANAEMGIVESVTYKNITITRLEHTENDVVNHVLDCAFLNYDQIRKIKSMDTWDKKHWINDIEYLEQKGKEKRLASAREAMRLAAKDNKTQIRKFKEMVLAGENPHRVLEKWGKH
jgi:hypothetical protein